MEITPTNRTDALIERAGEEAVRARGVAESVEAARLDLPTPMNPHELHEVHDLQDYLMARQSPEGRPPRHDLRIAEWKWLALGIAVLAVMVTLALVAQGIAPGWIVLAGVLALCFLGIGISPVLYAGLLRGGEERDARRTAAAVVKHDAALTEPPH